jgi:NADH-quinone oxidoreductase subunit K
MSTIGLPDWGLIVAGVLFVFGLLGVLMRRNIIFILVSVEVMLNACGLAFISAGSALGRADGQIMFIFILTLAAAEAAVGLALIIQFYRHFKSLDADDAKEMRG